MNTEKTKSGLKRGDSWRDETVHRCEVCHTLTNRVVLGGYPGMGPRILCPGDQYKEHDQLEARLKEYVKVEERIGDYEQASKDLSDEDRESVRDLLKDLYTERKLLDARITQLRAKFQDLDDVEGVDEQAEVVDYRPQARFGGEKERLD